MLLMVGFPGSSFFTPEDSLAGFWHLDSVMSFLFDSGGGLAPRTYWNLSCRSRLDAGQFSAMTICRKSTQWRRNWS